MSDAPSIARALAAAFGGGWSVVPLHASGFCDAWRAAGADTRFFLKSLPADSAHVLEAEADGLSALAATGTVRVPAVGRCWTDDESALALLALDWLDLHPPHAGFGARFGRALGALHRAPPPVGGGRYGWRRDNMLGGTPQLNRWSNTSDAQSGLSGWLEFLAEQRLGALRARLALSHGHSELIDSVAAIIQALPAFFADGYAPRASLIHGDLWQGNWGMLADGTPVIYDPAVSCSDAEAELAMMELFGGPPANFWNAYRESAGVHDGYARRRGLYQLYHLLNHVLLFGGGYGRQALILARGLLSEV